MTFPETSGRSRSLRAGITTPVADILTGCAADLAMTVSTRGGLTSEATRSACGRVLIINNGSKAVEGTLDEIRRALPDLEGDANLEEIFLRATGLDED